MRTIFFKLTDNELNGNALCQHIILEMKRNDTAEKKNVLCSKMRYDCILSLQLFIKIYTIMTIVVESQSFGTRYYFLVRSQKYEIHRVR